MRDSKTFLLLVVLLALGCGSTTKSPNSEWVGDAPTDHDGNVIDVPAYASRYGTNDAVAGVELIPERSTNYVAMPRPKPPRKSSWMVIQE